MKNSKKTESRNRRASAVLQRFLLKTVLLAVLLTLLFTRVFSIRRAVGNEMSPYVRDGDLCIFMNTPEFSTGDVVLYRNPEGSLKIGRITALGGQTIEFSDNGGYTVDGYEPAEEIPYETWYAEESEAEFPLALSEDQVFLMNDFRSLKNDSRTWGALDRSRVRGSLLFQLRRRGF